MKKLRWQILVVAITVVIVALLLLSQQPVSVPFLPEAAPGGIYTEALVGSMGRLNPMLDWNNPADRDINRLIFSGLIHFDSRGLPQLDLAESWGTSPDGTLYNFSIRPNAVWHDGQSVTTDDVVFTMSEWFKEEVGSSIAGLMSYMDATGIEKVDDYTVRLNLNAAEIAAPEHLFHYSALILNNRTFEGDFLKAPHGTGPYTLDTYTEGERVLLQSSQGLLAHGRRWPAPALPG